MHPFSFTSHLSPCLLIYISNKELLLIVQVAGLFLVSTVCGVHVSSSTDKNIQKKKKIKVKYLFNAFANQLVVLQKKKNK